MSDLHTEEIEGTTVTTVVPLTQPSLDLSSTPQTPPETPAEALPGPPSERPELEPDEPPSEGEFKPKTKYQSRIDRLTAERYEAEARATVEAERRAALEQELAQLRQPQSVPPPPETEPQRGDYSDDDQYIAALVSYRTRQEVAPVLAAVQQAIEAERAERARVEAVRIYHERIAAQRSEYPDFDAVTSQDLPISPVMADLIVASSVGPRLSYYLGSHPEECVALSKLPPIQAAKELGVLEARLSAAPTGTATQVTTRPSAPPPVKPVGGAPTAAVSSLWSPTISQAEFERIRNEQERARRSR